MNDKKTITITIEEYNSLLEKQKQVDELKEKLWKSKQDMMTYHSKTVAEAVKDTAKNILSELDLFFKGTTFRKGYEFKKINEKLKELAKNKGVEME
jgi:hypothetical protein